MARRDEDAALKVAASLLAGEEEAEATEGDAAAAEQDTDETVASQDAETEETEDDDIFPNWEIEVPEDLREELDAPVLEDLDTELDQDEEYLELNEEGRKLYARALAAERKAAFYEKQRVSAETKNWQAEAKKFFPLSEPFLDDITETSRRGYLREAERQHKKVLPLVKPIADRQKANEERIKAEAKAAAKEEAKQAWGTTASDEAPAEASITMEQLQRNREKGDLVSTVKAMIFPTKE